MATRQLTRSLFTKFSLFSSSTSSIHRVRPLSAGAISAFRHLPPVASLRGYSTRTTSSSLKDPNPNWSNRPPKETILLDGCDFEHWLVVMDNPEGDPTRDEIIDSYIKTLAMVVGSEEEARMKIYSVSTRCYFAFGALVSEELSYKIKELPRVRWVLPDSYLDVRNKDYGGEPFIDGKAVPYDPKYHEEWLRNHNRATDRNRRNDRPRNTDRSRNFERRRENMQNRDFQNRGAPPQNSAPNMGRMPLNNTGGVLPNNTGGMPPPPNYTDRMPQNNMGGMPPNNWGGMPPPSNYTDGMPQNNTGGMPPPSNYTDGMPPNNTGGMPPNNWGGMPPNNRGGMPPNNRGGMPPNNMGGMPPNNMGGGMPPDMRGISPNNYGRPPPSNMPTGNMPNFQNSGGMPSHGQVSNTEYQNSYAHNMGGVPGGNPHQA